MVAVWISIKAGGYWEAYLEVWVAHHSSLVCPSCGLVQHPGIAVWKSKYAMLINTRQDHTIKNVGAISWFPIKLSQANMLNGTQVISKLQKADKQCKKKQQNNAEMEKKHDINRTRKINRTTKHSQHTNTKRAWNTQQHTATYCNTVQYNTLQHTRTHLNKTQHNRTHLNRSSIPIYQG